VAVFSSHFTSPWVYESSRVGRWGLKKTPLLMGVINLTPDSFSDGGEIRTKEDFLQKVEEMVPYVDLLDVGAESTRPGAREVPPEEQIERLKPLFSTLHRIPLPVSVDTRSSLVAEVALREGVEIINDVSGGTFDPRMYEVVVTYKPVYIAMHMRGVPENMMQFAHYEDLFSEIQKEWLKRITPLLSSGFEREKIWFDPGIGFSKDMDQCWDIVRKVSSFLSLGFPVVVGHSRKRFLRKVLDEEDPKKRDFATWILTFYLSLTGVHVIRVHEGKFNRVAVKMAEILKSKESPFALHS